MTKIKVSGFLDAFELTRCIPLELTDDSAIVEVSSMVIKDQMLFVHDKRTNQALIFDLDGNFIKPLATKGDGPGEIREVSRIFEWGEQIALSNRGDIQVYETDGTYIHTLPFIDLKMRAHHGAIRNGDQAIVGQLTSMYRDTPLHYIADISKPDDLKPIYGFGRRAGIEYRRDGIRHRKMPILSVRHFNLFGDYIWAAYPYSGRIHIYTRDGYQIAKLPSEFDNASFETFEYFADRDDALLELSKWRTCDMLVQAGPYVLAGYNKGGRWKYNLFDVNGNMIKHDLDRHKLPLIYATHSGGQYMTLAVPIADITWDNALEKLFGDDYRKFLNAGYDITKHQDYNPWVLLYEPKPQAIGEAKGS